LTEDQVEAAIDAQIVHYSRLGLPFEWKVYDYDQPADLKERLERRGFQIGDGEALVVLDLNDHPEVPNAPISPLVRRVVDAAGVDDIMKMEERVWGYSHSQHGEHLKKDLETHPDNLTVYAAYDRDIVVSAAWIYFHPGTDFASLWGGSTLPEYRQQGLYTSLLAVRAREAQQRGYRFLTVDASPMSRPILEKHGFQLLGFSYPCEWKPE
jgi:GNAT superfamily N-acetyltransferase